MLDNQDLQAIARLLDESIRSSETRMMQRMDAQRDDILQRMDAQRDDILQRMDAQRDDILQRMDEKILASEARMVQRMDEQILASETRMMQRMDEQILASEARMVQRMDAQRDDILQQAARNTQVILENTVLPQFKLLAEGHETLLETMTSKRKTEELEEEVDFLKSIVRTHTEQIAELEKKLA